MYNQTATEKVVQVQAAATEMEVREDSEEAAEEPSFQGVPQM